MKKKIEMKDKIFFNYATVAPMSDTAFAATEKFLEEFHRVGPPEVLYEYDIAMPKELSVEAAKLLNCDPSEITYVKNTSEGIILAAESLPLEAGDEIIVQANEYPANLLPWMKKRKNGITVTIIEGEDNKRAFEDLLSMIGPNTKAISISYAQYYDGYMADLEKLSKICQEKGIFLVIDAAQVVGVRKIDLKKTHCDFLVSGGQKYLCAGMGIGLMYVNKDTLPKLRDTKVAIRSMATFDSNGYQLKDTAERFQDGTHNLAGIVALHAAIKELNDIGMENIEKKNLELLTGIKTIVAKYNIPFIDHGDRQSNIVSMKIDHALDLFNYLKDRNVYIRPIKDKIARISFIHESKLEDAETVAKLTREWLDRK